MKTGRYNLLLALFCTLILSGSCVRDRYDQPNPGGKPGKVVMVSLKVSLPPAVSPAAATPAAFSAPQARSAARVQDNRAFTVCLEPDEPRPETRASDGTTELYNLWLFQFDAGGGIKGLPHKITDKITAVNDMVTIDVPLTVAENQTLYLLALGPAINLDLSSIRSLTELENLSFGYLTNKGGRTVSLVTSDSQIPFAGKVSGATVLDIDNGERGLVEYNKPDGFSGGIEIRRLMARVTLRYNFEVPDYKLQGMKLLNVNDVIRLSNPDTNPDSDAYAEIEGTVSENPDPDGFYTVTWYIAQNRQGTADNILSESDRYHKTEGSVTSGNAPALGTHIEAWAYSEKSSDEYAIYQMYVGNNNINNFDVEANHVYNLRTTINAELSSTQTDGRIRSYTAAMMVYLTANDRMSSSSNDKKVLSQGRNGAYEFDAHFDSRPILVTLLGRRLDIGIYADKACTLPVSPNDTWMRISSSSNYTEAVNNIADPLGTTATATVILPTQLKFYLYTDEYLYDTDGNIPDPAAYRTLYVQFRTTTEGVSGGDVKKFSAVYELRQMPAFYVGRFGGPKQGGQYTQGLVYDRIVEYEKSYTAENKAAGTTKRFGYYKIDFYKGYTDRRDADYGKPATRYLAENPNNLDIGANIDNFVLPRKDAFGNVLLYQYSYYDSYAARFCYDRNRDENGNGVIDPEELKWYLPAVNQGLGYLAAAQKGILSGGSWTATEQSYTYMNSFWSLGYLGTNTKSSPLAVRCVRDIDMPAKVR